MNANVIARKLESLQQKGSIRSVDVANVLHIRPETVSRWNQGKAFPQPDAERTLLDLEYVVDQLADLYKPDEARMWLFSRQRLLNGEIPADLIQQRRTEEVLKLIHQLLEGVYV
jgi:transcriptional regulator with XRE-family HTH domain